jgi:hypothetical protein
VVEGLFLAPLTALLGSTVIAVIPEIIPSIGIFAARNPQLIEQAGNELLQASTGNPAPASIPSSVKPPKTPDFVVSPGGTVFPVPKGANGPTPVINPAGNKTGVAFTNGAGGANGQVSTMRIMNPTLPKGSSPGYPNGYIKYENSVSPKPQGVNPYSGKTLSNSQSHFPID